MNAPVLLAYIRGHQMVVWCEPEQRWHFHGFNGDLEDSTGDRTAHCIDDDSPYRPDGYVLTYAGRFEDLPSEIQRRWPLGGRRPRRRKPTA